MAFSGHIWHNFLDDTFFDRFDIRHNMLYTPSPMSTSDLKHAALLGAGTLHPRPDQVSHPLFHQNPFFDPNDLLQVKYEALRAWEQGEHPLSSLARDFALSRPTLYSARAALCEHGLAGLLPNKRGPKRAHKLTDDVLDYLEALLNDDPTLEAPDLLRSLREDLGVALHLRTLEKALRQGLHLKKGREAT